MGRNCGFFPFFEYMLSTGLVIGIICGLGLGILIFLPVLIRKQKIDTARLKEYEHKEYMARAKFEELTQECLEKDKESINLKSRVDVLKQEIDNQRDNLNTLKNEEDLLRKTLASLADTEKKIKSNMEKSIEERSEALSKEYQNATEKYQKEYTATIQEMANEFQKAMVGKRAELHLLEDAISDKKKFMMLF